MPELRWTTEPPTVPGWYWVRWSPRKPWSGQSEVEVVEVLVPKSGAVYLDHCGRSPEWESLSANWLEWSGPIPEPTGTPPTTGGEGKNR